MTQAPAPGSSGPGNVPLIFDKPALFVDSEKVDSSYSDPAKPSARPADIPREHEKRREMTGGSIHYEENW